MESFKKELFRKEYNTDFPFYDELKNEECIKIKNNIKDKYQIQEIYFDNNLNKIQIFLID
ncbi:hypothetical protein [Chryseobacterium vrystaatense]|uniref:Uncharacterized protein n=1 Tax=Chryseobacterium vrystaatense TaxID=307480 RepID=A0ABR4UQ71_9FLAO|nr:hypothetical protein [Chryseobacterium vrystaatense]KFF27267.1 hypothetical protein IW16_08425 [Chryseobacterium vrystaatense]